MRERSITKHTEAAFLGLIAVLSLVLVAIQYRWTGEISRIEKTRLRSGLQDRLRQLSRAIDTEFLESCHELIPSAEELDRTGKEAAHLKRFQQWSTNQRRPLFARVAVAVPTSEELALFELNRTSGVLAPTPWPAEWFPLRDQLDAVRRGGSFVPLVETTSTQIEFPVFGEGTHHPSGLREREWVIFDLDMNYVRNVWLPELVRANLNSGEENEFDLTITWLKSTDTLLFSTQPKTERTDWHPEATAMTFTIDIVRGRPGRSMEASAGRWFLAARYHEGELDSMIARARWRNFSVAAGVNAMILASGWMLLRQTRRARESAEMQVNFVAGVSHELRTPLTVIRSAGHNLVKGVVKDPDRVSEYGRLIVAKSEQLAQMIEQVLEFSRHRLNRGAADFEVLSLPALVKETLEALAEEIRNAGFTLEVAMGEQVPEINGDAAALRRTVENLVNNALRHARSGKWVGVRVERRERRGVDGVQIAVADKGEGLTAKEQVHLFEPFHRGERARRQQIGGTGLGLSLVREVAQSHGGEVTVASRPGGGAEFQVWLPRHRNATNP